jgi:hypothetical protein
MNPAPASIEKSINQLPCFAPHQPCIKMALLGKTNLEHATRTDDSASVTRHSYFDHPSMAAFAAAALLFIIVVAGLAASAVLFAAAKHKNHNLNTFQGSITDPKGVRFVLTMVVTSGSLLFLASLMIWLCVSFRKYERGRKRRLSKYFGGREVPKEYKWFDPAEEMDMEPSHGQANLNHSSTAIEDSGDDTGLENGRGYKASR